MSTRLAIVAEPAAAGVAGLEGSFAWGDAAIATVAAGAVAADVVVALGGAAAGDREPDVRWLGDPPAGAPPPGRRLVATVGDGLWSRAPWPVRDELFELAPPHQGAGLLVVTADEERHAALLEKLAARALPFDTAPELTADALAAAAAVAFPPDPGENGSFHAPGALLEAVPAACFAALAARRPLIGPRTRLTFGLLPGVDHLAAGTDDEVVQYADALSAFPDAFAPQVALGRIAAERQRASTLYGRLVADVQAGD